MFEVVRLSWGSVPNEDGLLLLPLSLSSFLGDSSEAFVWAPVPPRFSVNSLVSLTVSDIALPGKSLHIATCNLH